MYFHTIPYYGQYKTRSFFMNINIVPLQFDLNSTEPLYAQLFHYLKDLIIKGDLAFGDKLPAIRSFAKALEVNNITVINAYKQLEHTGYVTSKQGSGYYVSKRLTEEASVFTPKPLYQQELINFSSASPDPGIFPTETFKEYIVEVMDRDKGYAFGYQEVNGFMKLREVLAQFLKQTYDIETKAELIQMVSGAQQGLDIIAKSLLYSGDSVITENPTYNGAVDVFKSRGCRIVPVSLTPQGLDLIEFEKKVKICKPKLVYIMPNFQNPTTICYNKATLLALLKLAHTYDFYLLEEDSMWELTYGTRGSLSLKSLDTEDRVIYLKSFSKLLMPGLRIGFIIMPEALVEAFTRTKQTTDISSSGLMQRALELYFKNNKWEEHIHYMKRIYKDRYECMLSKLLELENDEVELYKPQGGVCFWLRLPKGMSAQHLYEKCHKKGLLIFPSPIFFPHLDPSKDRYIRLSFAACGITDIQKGTDILTECIRTYH